MDFSSVDSAIWDHPVMRQTTEAGGRLYLYLVTKARDCEGRFVADAFHLLEGCWSRRHDADEQQVEEALQSLAKLGVVLLYQDGQRRYGFLLGWYEHQRVDAKYRDGSSLPPPPVHIFSWERVDILRRFYAESVQIDATRSSRKAAISWFHGLSEERQAELLPVQRPLRAIIPIGTESAPNLHQSGADSGVGRSGDVDGEVVGEEEVVENNPPPEEKLSLKDECCRVLLEMSGGRPGDKPGPALLQIVENAIGLPGAKEVILVEAMSLAARHAEGDNVHLSYLSRNVSSAVDRAELQALGNAPAADPTTTVRRYPREKLEQMRESGVGLLADNTQVAWAHPRNVLVAQLEATG